MGGFLPCLAAAILRTCTWTMMSVDLVGSCWVAGKGPAGESSCSLRTARAGSFDRWVEHARGKAWYYLHGARNSCKFSAILGG